MVGEFLREAVNVEAAHAGDVLAQVLAPGSACVAGAADQGGVGYDAIAGGQCADIVADRDDLARCFGADAQWELPLGEGHAAEAPNVDVVQSDGADAKLHLAGRRWRRWVALHQRDVAVSQQLQGAHCHEPWLSLRVS